MSKHKIVIAFIPVIHRGYLNFLESVGAEYVFLLEAVDVPELPYLARETRALTVAENQRALRGFGYSAYSFQESKMLIQSMKECAEIYMPDEDICHVVHEKHLKEYKVVFTQTFLRWDWKRSTAVTESVIPDSDRVISKDDPEWGGISARMRLLLELRFKSSDWWRQVSGMAVCKDGRVLVAYNKHFPNEYAPYIDGDPRNNFGPGEFIDVSTALHAEKGIISQAARLGMSLEGAELFSTTFPCNDCANQIVETGMNRVFFAGGYSNLNGAKTLRDREVELVYVVDP